ncbi:MULTISPECIES: transporter [Pandoraea]|uniref:SphA family protein n=1 Tax=Pandoraea TaxID=93217 RepID=UPI001F5DE1C9|nr:MULTISPECIES: transporter [Pandoraea]MCI3203520.1 phenol degradation protein meta [Pandoraea sp. LA3]MDN4581546.1 phenol degradation protein meta [Pandoraea capi]
MKIVTSLIRVCGGTLTALLCLAWSSTNAAEGPAFGGPVGGSDIGAAYLPGASGFYGAAVAGYAHGDHFYGDNGKRADDTAIQNKSGVVAAGLLYVYPVKWLGGTLGTTVQGSLSTGNIHLNGVSQKYDGTGDLYSDLLIWSRYLGSADVAHGAPPTGLTVRVAYSMLFGTGRYDKNAIVSTGRNVTYLIPNFALTYLTGPNWLGDGTEFSANFYWDIATKNRATGYLNGPVFDVDLAVSERIGKWQIGVAGYYATQMSGDQRDGLPIPGGNKFGSAAIGPVIAYTIPEWKSSVKFKLQLPLYARNSMTQTVGYLVFSKAFN